MGRVKPELPHFKKRRNSYTPSEVEAEKEEFEKEDKGQEDLAYVETLVSRTVSYKIRTTHERSSRLENGHGQAHTRCASAVKDAYTSDGTPLSSTITSPNTLMNLEEMKMQVKDLNRELERMILRGAKYRVDLDSIEAKSEERRRLKDAISQTKKLQGSLWLLIVWWSPQCCLDSP